MWRWLEHVLWGLAVLGLGTYAASVGERHTSQAYLSWKFEETLAAPCTFPAGVTAEIPTGTEPMGRIEIPSIGLSAIFTEGTDARTLRRGVGHIPGTALPGKTGNAGLSAHRDTFFRHLGKLRKGDAISVTTMGGPFKYVVESSRIVDPNDSSVLKGDGRTTLTLVTCYPFYYVGSAPKRFVVHARLAE